MTQLKYERNGARLWHELRNASRYLVTTLALFCADWLFRIVGTARVSAYRNLFCVLKGKEGPSLSMYRLNLVSIEMLANSCSIYRRWLACIDAKIVISFLRTLLRVKWTM